MINITGVICPNCGDTIISRARHDFHFCSCHTVFVDGGFEYLRYGLRAKEPFQLPDIKIVTLNLDITTKELYDDWNYSHDKYGIIPQGE